MKATVIIPAHNEEALIADTVRAALTIPGVEQLIVVDDGSDDETAAVASAAGADIVRMEHAGKGAALDAGLEVVSDYDILVLIDADLGETAVQAGKLVAPVSAGAADMAVATFPPPMKPGGFGLVKGLARTGIRLLGGGFRPEAPLSGQRVLTRKAVDHVTPFAFGYGVEVAMTVRALRANLKIVEVATEMTHSETGRDISGFAHRARQFGHVAGALVKLVFEKRGRR